MKTININGYDVEIHNFGNESYMYPVFNGDMEVEANLKGYKKLSSYFRGIKRLDKMEEDFFGYKPSEMAGFINALHKYPDFKLISKFLN